MAATAAVAVASGSTAPSLRIDDEVKRIGFIVELHGGSGIHGWSGLELCLDRAVVAGGGIEPVHESDLNEPAGRASAGEHGNNVDRLGNESARDRDHGLLHELL